jgi:phage repressor protein C with HTH and peptisase S24 domain
MRSLTFPPAPPGSDGRSPLQLTLERLMREKGYTMKGLALASGTGETAVRDIIVGRSKRPSYDTLKKIADTLGCRPEDLTGVPPEPAAKPAPVKPPMMAPALPPALPAELPPGIQAEPVDFGRPDLPILGRAQGGPQGVLMIPVEQRPVDWTYRPPQLRGVADAFAIFVYDDSMDPRYRNGQILWIHPHMPLKQGDGVLIIKTSNEALVKELIRRTAASLTVKEYKPKEREFSLAMEEIRQLYRIVGALDVR